MNEISNIKKMHYSNTFSLTKFLLLVLTFAIGKINAQQFEYINLSSHVNQSFTDERANDGVGGWADFGKFDCFHNLPLEINTFDDGIIPFKIINSAENNGNSVLVLSGPERETVFPKASNKILVDEKFESLFFLHTCMYVNDNADELIKYTMHYEDNSEVDFVCHNKKEIADWWEPNANLPNATRTYVESQRWLINTPWNNPHPDKKIEWITMHSKGEGIPFLVAITGAKDAKPYQEIVIQIDSKLKQYELTNVKIALLQLKSEPDPQINLKKGTELCREAAKNNADIALFPELYNIGYNGIDFQQPGAIEKWKGMAIGKDSEFVRHFKSLAKELNMAIVITYLEDIGNDALPRNSASLIDRHGEIVFTYAKVHTCDFSNLENSTTPGDDFYVKVLDTKAGPVNIGMMICYDREFPESARILMLKGAEIILTPNACVLEKMRLSQFRVRAMENAVAMVMTNYCSEIDRQNYNGNSCIFNADASQVIVAEKEEGIFYGSLNLNDIRNYRKETIWGDAFRRPHKYRKLESLDVNDEFKRKDSFGDEFERKER